MSLAEYVNRKPTIETDRLFLRPMTAADVPALKRQTRQNYYAYGILKMDMRSDWPPPD